MAEEHEYKNLCEELVSQWRKEGVALNSGAARKELSELEALLGWDLPQSFRYLYSLANGMADSESDSHLFSLWPLTSITEEIMRVRSGSIQPPEIELPFGDFLIDSYRYLLKPTGKETYSVRVDFEMKPLTESFVEFLKFYLSEPDRIYLM